MCLQAWQENGRNKTQATNNNHTTHKTYNRTKQTKPNTTMDQSEYHKHMQQK